EALVQAPPVVSEAPLLAARKLAPVGKVLSSNVESESRSQKSPLRLFNVVRRNKSASLSPPERTPTIMSAAVPGVVVELNTTPPPARTRNSLAPPVLKSALVESAQTKLPRSPLRFPACAGVRILARRPEAKLYWAPAKLLSPPGTTDDAPGAWF